MNTVIGYGRGTPTTGLTPEQSESLEMESVLLEMAAVLTEIELATQETQNPRTPSDTTGGIRPVVYPSSAAARMSRPLQPANMSTLGGLRSLFAPIETGPSELSPEFQQILSNALAPTETETEPPIEPLSAEEPLISGLSLPPVDIFPSATVAAIGTEEELQ